MLSTVPVSLGIDLYLGRGSAGVEKERERQIKTIVFEVVEK